MTGHEHITFFEPPEFRVFGPAFTYPEGPADIATQKSVQAERLAQMETGQLTWLSRGLDSLDEVEADLYRQRQLIATIGYDPDTDLAELYSIQEGINIGDVRVVLMQGTLDEVVIAAEALADSHNSGDRAPEVRGSFHIVDVNLAY